MRQERINRITKILLDIMFYSGLVVFVTLPWTLKLAGTYYSEDYSDNYLSMLCIFALAGVCGLLIISQLRRMMKTVLTGACFVYAKVRCLERMAALSLMIAALFSQVLANVFAEAIRYKEENDLMI